MRRSSSVLIIAIISIFLQSCSEKGPAGIFAKRTLHEKYADKLAQTGLVTTNLGKLWLSAADKSFTKPQSVKLPYQEKGYFGADKPAAIAYIFSAKRGEKITVNLEKKPASNFMIYLDIWESNSTQLPGKYIISNDTITNSLTFEAGSNLQYIMRIQPELLASGEYHLTITNGPSLGFPVMGKSSIQSVFGVGRDNDTRKHEGVDIFASRGTPAIAASRGTVTRVGTNNLGGNVVFMRPEDKDYTLYYAHLDKQLVTDGQTVLPGDTIGLVGNTGNAITTSPHLHFGIYTFGGAIDPTAFIIKNLAPLQSIKGNTELLGGIARTNKSIKLYQGLEKNNSARTLPVNSVLTVLSATADRFLVELPDLEQGFVETKDLNRLSKISTLKLKEETPIYATPDLLAPIKLTATAGESVAIFGSFSQFNYVEVNGVNGWISK